MADLPEIDMDDLQAAIDASAQATVEKKTQKKVEAEAAS